MTPTVASRRRRPRPRAPTSRRSRCTPRWPRRARSPTSACPGPVHGHPGNSVVRHTGRLPAPRRAGRTARPPGVGDPRDLRGGGRLLRAQRCRRRVGGRRDALQGSRQAVPGDVVTPGRARLGAARPGDDARHARRHHGRPGGRWEHVVCTPTHSSRPSGNPGTLLAGQRNGALPMPCPPAARQRDAQCPGHLHVPQQPVARPSGEELRDDWCDVAHPGSAAALPAACARPRCAHLAGSRTRSPTSRSWDELAAAADVDPLELRLRSLDDPRATAVVEALGDAWAGRPTGATAPVPASPSTSTRPCSPTPRATPRWRWTLPPG